MAIQIFGVNHTTAPVALRERLYIDHARVGEVLRELCELPRVEEAVVLSTCNRTEVYTASASVSAPIDFLAQYANITVDEITPHLYDHEGYNAARHLFRVAAGLDSLVIGETQILGQVSGALETACTYGTVGRQLSSLFQHALAAGKRVRTETVISEGTFSIGRVAAELARSLFPDLQNRAALVLGAGQMSEITAKHLAEYGVHPILVANRTHAHAVDVANRLGGQAIHYTDLGDALTQVDILISSTSAPHYVLNAGEVLQAMAKRGDRPLFLIDIAIPRDIDPAVAELPNVHLYNIDDLQAITAQSSHRRLAEVPKVEEIVAEEVERWRRRRAGMDIAPVISALRDSFAQVRRTELARSAKVLAELTPEQQQAVEALTAAMLNKILHAPTVRLKELMARHHSDLPVSLLCELFDLTPTPSEEEK